MARLIERCICGSYPPFAESERGAERLKVAACAKCGTLHQVTDATRAEVAHLYQGEYHASSTRHPNCTPYAARYSHDLDVAARRWRRYNQVLNGQLQRRDFRALDVGAANGAFVDHVRGLGLLALGVDPDPAMTRDAVQLGTLEDVHGLFSLITYHDVLEHLVDPRGELLNARGRAHDGAVIVVDVPDVFTGRGDHHFKAEHLWFFTDEQLRHLLYLADFRVHAIDRPIPGKMVAYGIAV